MMTAYQCILNRLWMVGPGFKKHILNNKASKAFKTKIKVNRMDYALVPPRNHLWNQAEQARQTFKAHFIFVLVRVNDNNSPYPSGAIY